MLALCLLGGACEAGDMPPWKDGDVFRVVVLRYARRAWYGFTAPDAYVAEVHISILEHSDYVVLKWKPVTRTGTFGRSGIQEYRMGFDGRAQGLFRESATRVKGGKQEAAPLLKQLSVLNVSLPVLPLQPIPWCSEEVLNRRIAAESWNLHARVRTKTAGAIIERELRVTSSDGKTTIYRIKECGKAGGKWWMDRYEYLFGRLVLEAHLLPPAPPDSGLVPKRK